jgi:hypothetical protein
MHGGRGGAGLTDISIHSAPTHEHSTVGILPIDCQCPLHGGGCGKYAVA